MSTILKTLIILYLIIPTRVALARITIFKAHFITTQARPYSQLDFYSLLLPFYGICNKPILQKWHSSCSILYYKVALAFEMNISSKTGGYLLKDIEEPHGAKCFRSHTNTRAISFRFSP